MLPSLYVVSMLSNPSNSTYSLFVREKQLEMLYGGKQNFGECLFKIALQCFHARQAVIGLWIKTCYLCHCHSISV